MLFVNTIEFAGRKAVINSYSGHPALVDNMNKQRTNWSAEYPNATVQTEEMSFDATAKLVAEGVNQYGTSAAWDIGQASKA